MTMWQPCLYIDTTLVLIFGLISEDIANKVYWQAEQSHVPRNYVKYIINVVVSTVHAALPEVSQDQMS